MAKTKDDEAAEDAPSAHQQVIDLQNLLSGVEMDANIRNDANALFDSLKNATKE